MKPFSLDKFRKSVNKSLGITAGYHDPKTWVSTGNFAVNKLVSNSYFRGIPLGKVSVLAGESGSGKSFLTCGSLIKNAIEQGITCIILDSEFAIDAEWLRAAGVDTDSPFLDRMPVSTVDEVATMVTLVMKQYIEDNGDKPYEERQPLLLVIDSLGMLSTPTEMDQFQKGDMKGDLGRKAKQLKALVTQCLKMFGPHPIGMVATNHVYASQNAYAPDDVISGGSGFIFASSIIITMNKLKLKLDEDGNKIAEVRGIRSKIKVVKSRFAKPFEEIEVQIPYDTGLSPYSGLFDLLEKKGILKKDGVRYVYTAKDGEILKMFRKEWNSPENAHHFDRVMRETDEDEDVIEGVGAELEEAAEE
jgi:RecA/RadA recombinase